ncbi:alpha/beta hydrolase [Lentzea aerocolonigenes]|uniref:Alpha/beta hydrolase n=1 Tax=Lentzea aerocolonigenes TaxID=68170 RepID=A0A0F0GJK3_LENAE|nr:alpha/beta fold hydrolase [Lentzea aerocolonigenes]KJK43525.1 alpha/beta hydrolase [Lentzea aerocolonigenes]
MSSQHTAGTRPSWVDAGLFPFESHFIELNGHTVHYVDEGSGPILVMLHGNPTWSFVYRDVISSLKDRFRCIALDYPGFGLSTAAPGYGYKPADHAGVVVEFLDRLDISGATLVAHDWGGPIGLFAAEQRPDRFTRIVLANTWAWPANGELKAEMASRVMGGFIGRELIRRFNVFVNALVPAGHRRRKVSDAEMKHYREALDTTERRNACAILPGAITGARDFLADVETNLKLISDLPTLIVWADADMAFGDNDRKRLEERFPDHTTVIVKGAGHFVQSDAADEVSAAIRDWWKD